MEKNYPYNWGLIARNKLTCIKESHELLIAEVKNRNLINESCYIFQIGSTIKKRTFGVGTKIK